MIFKNQQISIVYTKKCRFFLWFMYYACVWLLARAAATAGNDGFSFERHVNPGSWKSRHFLGWKIIFGDMILNFSRLRLAPNILASNYVIFDWKAHILAKTHNFLREPLAKTITPLENLIFAPQRGNSQVLNVHY